MQCKNCGFYYDENEIVCPVCGTLSIDELPKEKGSILKIYKCLKNKFITEYNSKIIINLFLLVSIFIILINTVGITYLEFGIKNRNLKPILFKNELSYNLSLSYLFFFLIAFLFNKFFIEGKKKIYESDNLFVIEPLWIIFYATSIIYFFIKFVYFIKPIEEIYVIHHVSIYSVNYYIYMYTFFYFLQLLLYIIILLILYNTNVKVKKCLRVQVAKEDYILKFSKSYERKKTIVREQTFRKTIIFILIVIYLISMFDLKFLVTKVNKNEISIEFDTKK